MEYVLEMMESETIKECYVRLEADRYVGKVYWFIGEIAAAGQGQRFKNLQSSINLCCEVCLWDTSDAMMEPDKEITYWFFFIS